MLDDAETYNNQRIVTWQPNGLAFRVHRPDDFVSKIMPHYFHQTQYRSFQRMVSGFHLLEAMHMLYQRVSISRAASVKITVSRCLLLLSKRNDQNSLFWLPFHA